jgi:hypothetical protein
MLFMLRTTTRSTTFAHRPYQEFALHWTEAPHRSGSWAPICTQLHTSRVPSVRGSY